MVKKKLVSAFMAAAMSAAMLTGCGSSGTESTTAAPASTEATEAKADTEAKDTEAKDTEAKDTEAEKPADTSEGTKKVGIAMPTKSLERWNRDGSFLEEQFKSQGFEVVERKITDSYQMVKPK